jgi:Uncharacterized protein conserved in bacteria (DUF2087)
MRAIWHTPNLSTLARSMALGCLLILTGCKEDDLLVAQTKEAQSKEAELRQELLKVESDHAALRREVADTLLLTRKPELGRIPVDKIEAETSMADERISKAKSALEGITAKLEAYKAKFLKP